MRGLLEHTGTLGILTTFTLHWKKLLHLAQVSQLPNHVFTLIATSPSLICAPFFGAQVFEVLRL